MEHRNENIKPSQRLRLAISETFLEFRTYSSIHGVKYMFANNRLFWTRIMWTTSFTMALVYCTFMVIHSLQEFNSNPIMHSIDAYRSHLSEFPFPAVTICNENHFLKSRARCFVDSLRMPPSTDINRSSVHKALHLLAALSSADISYNIDLGTGRLLQDVLDYNNVTIKDAFEQLYQPCSNLLERCRWEGKTVDCSELFDRRITYHGYCCSFNYALDRGEGPRRGFHYGAGEGLTVLLDVASHDVLPGTAVSLGAKVILHHNSDFPDLGTERARCGMGQEWLINLHLIQQHHDDSLRTLSVNQRQCMFQEETPTYYNQLSYSTQNCQMVCRIEKVHNMCGCIAFYIPEAVGSLSLSKARRICNLRDLHCLSDKRVEFETAEGCLCLQACTKVQFFHNIHSGNLKATSFHHHETFYDGANMTDRTVLHIYIGAHLRTRILTSVSYSLYALMALLGGYCSLFLGCSLLSGLEIVYFTFIRLIRRLQSKTELWKPQQMLILSLQDNAVRDPVVTGHELEQQNLQSQEDFLS